MSSRVVRGLPVLVPSLVPPSVLFLFPWAGADGVVGLEETWQGHAVWFQRQFQLSPGFYNQIKKQKAKKKKRGRGERGEVAKSICRLGNDISICQLIQSPSSPRCSLFFSFLFLPCKLISLFFMWKDCKWGSPDMDWARTNLLSVWVWAPKMWPESIGSQMEEMFNSQVSGCPGEITDRLSTHSPKYLCTWKVGSYLTSSASTFVQARETRTKKAFSLKSWIQRCWNTFFSAFFPPPHIILLDCGTGS